MATLIKEKITQAQGLLTELGLDCWLTFVRETALNGDPILPFLVRSGLTWHSALIVTPRTAIAVVGSLETATVSDLQVYDRVLGYVEGIRAPLHAVLQELAPRTIAVNFSTGSEVCDGITHGMYLTLVEMLAPLGMADRLVSAEQIISALRQRKTAQELAAMQRAIALTQTIYGAVTERVRPGVTEKELAVFMQALARRAGAAFAWEEETCPAVFTGPDSVGAHYGPTDRRVEPGHLVNMDFGLKVDAYCSDLQRTFYVRRPGETDAPEVVQRGFTVLRSAIEAAREKIAPGVRGIDVDAAARSRIVDAGYQEFPHALGHQVGRFAHDGTALLGPAWEKYAAKPLVPLEEGMVFTIEPRLFVEGHGTVTMEEMVRVTATGAEYLSTPQRELILR